jgi:aspartyl-tRNA(Asn)/glutamyl-tRNA(Gln) amidotransferase subunit C
MKLTIEEVRHVAELAKLTLTDAEVESFADQLSAILDYAEQVQEVDTSAVAPTPYVLPLVNVMDADEPRPSLENEVALANAPDRDNGNFRVKAIFEE